MNLNLNGSSVLITGGTGTLGKAATASLLATWPEIKNLVIYSRDEQKQFKMAQEYSPATGFPVRYIIGDVRDGERLKSACQGVDYVIHTAAMKHIHIAESNPEECIMTNIEGARNVIKAAFETSVRSVVALSTDKACAPASLYGATKLVADKLFIAANERRESRDIRFSVVRFGNIISSRGSVVPFFLKMKKSGVLPLTSESMTRFHISPEACVKMMLLAMEKAWGGEVFVPKIPSFRILDLARAIGPECEYKVVGTRPGEKIHEEMISASDSPFTYDLGRYYVIVPPNPLWKLDCFISAHKATPVPAGFTYHSGNNTQWETAESLRRLIRAQRFSGG